MCLCAVRQVNPLYQCYRGYHRSVGALAWYCLVTHLLAFPVLSFFVLRRAVPALESQPKAFRTIWRNFLDADFKPT